MEFGKNIRFTRLSATELGVAGVLALLGLGILWSAYKDFLVFYHFGDALVYYGSNKEALVVDRCEKAMASRPGYRFPFEMWAKIKVDNDDFDGAEKVYKRLTETYGIETAPDIATAHLGLGVIALRRFDKSKDAKLLDQARAAFEAAERAKPAPAEVAIFRGHADLRQGRVDAAAKQFDLAKQAQSIPTIDGLVDLYTGLGVLSYRKQKYTEARDHFRRAYELKPDRPLPLANTVYLEAQFYSSDQVKKEHLEDEALRLIDGSDGILQEMKHRMSIDPDRNEIFRLARFSLLTALASAFIRHGNFQKAEFKLEEAESEERVPREFAFLLRADLALAASRREGRQDFEKVGDWTKASDAYEKALKLDWDVKYWGKDALTPTKVAVLNNLAVLAVWRNDPQLKQKAIEALDRALKLAPKDPVLLRNRAVVNHLLKQYEEAVKDYTRCKEVLEGEKVPNAAKIQQVQDAIQAIETGEEGG
ncbi:MAG: tetratricopeptide repeat protein [Planctomycetes bacterium]|nr:tetratricopeptide repeat protein [Planctomycetota bacterium]